MLWPGNRAVYSVAPTGPVRENECHLSCGGGPKRIAAVPAVTSKTIDPQSSGPVLWAIAAHTGSPPAIQEGLKAAPVDLSWVLAQPRFQRVGSPGRMGAAVGKVKQCVVVGCHQVLLVRGGANAPDRALVPGDLDQRCSALPVGNQEFAVAANRHALPEPSTASSTVWQ